MSDWLDSSSLKCHFVEHHGDVQAPARVQPVAKWQVHSVEPKPMRNVLHQHTLVIGALDGSIQYRQRPRPEMTRQTMNADVRLRLLALVPFRRPDFNLVAGVDQRPRNQTGIVAHSSGLRRILAGDDLPVVHALTDSCSAPNLRNSRCPFREPRTAKDVI